MDDRPKNFIEERDKISRIVIGALERGFTEKTGHLDKREVLDFVEDSADKVMDIYRATGSAFLGRRMKMHEVEKGYSSVLQILSDGSVEDDNRYLANGDFYP